MPLSNSKFKSDLHINLDFSSRFFLVYHTRVATLNLPISNRSSAFISISVHQVSENKISQDTPDTERASSMKDDLSDQEYNKKRESEFNMKLVTSFSSYTMINKQQLCLFQVCLLQAVK